MGGEGAWAWERWESVGGCGRSSGEEGGVWAASGYLRGPYGLPRTVGKWCPVWGDLEHPVPLIWRAWPSGSPIGKLLGLGRGVLRGWCELLCVRLVETWTGRAPIWMPSSEVRGNTDSSLATVFRSSFLGM